MRRIILAGLALVAAATVFDIPAADAQVSSGRNPYCIRDGVGGPGSWDCSYHNLAQCMASASGAGGGCTTNPNYTGGRGRQTKNPPRDNSWGGGTYGGGTWGGGTYGWGGGRW